eukprot:Ihof_evm8s204 gene=Ihof_evmTU8s204
MMNDVFRYCISTTLNHHEDDMNFLKKKVDNKIKDRLKSYLANPVMAMTYTDAIEVLSRSGVGNFSTKPVWGIGLNAQHERYLCEQYCKGSLFVTDYPIELKPFYMRANEDGKTVACADLLVPLIGELAGGSL